MQIIIPMSGFGERFYKAGYKQPKSLIEIHDKPMIAHVIDMFPDEHDFIFICNQDHLDNADYQMEKILRRYCPTGRIVGIAPHKLGPVHAVLQVSKLLDPTQPALINYCDFTCYWDWADFKKFVKTTQCDGAIPAYKGFHPHSLGKTNYAYIQENNGWVQDIQEKQPYTNNRMNEYASSGSYYFSSAKRMLQALQRVIDQQLMVGGEYYVSLAYKPLLADNAAIAVYPLQHFMQWGTPEDLAEYNNWTAIFNRLMIPNKPSSAALGSLVVPMAGLGKRFSQEGYSTPKPLIPVSGKPMVIQAAHDLPATIHHVFVLRRDMPGFESISIEINKTHPNAIISTVPEVTQGQACTALIGLNALEQQHTADLDPVTFGACDNGALYNEQIFDSMALNPDIDVIVWGIRGHAHAAQHPSMYGWIEEVDGLIHHVSVKTPLKNPIHDPIVLGTFTFRRATDFHRTIEQLISRDDKINGEFYLDSCINEAIRLGLRCHLFEVDHVLSWGTPNDLKTFEYWQSCFHKWSGHPYRLEHDKRIPAHALPTLEHRYQAIIPERPKDLCHA